MKYKSLKIIKIAADVFVRFVHPFCREGCNRWSVQRWEVTRRQPNSFGLLHRYVDILFATT